MRKLLRRIILWALAGNGSAYDIQEWDAIVASIKTGRQT